MVCEPFRCAFLISMHTTGAGFTRPATACYGRSYAGVLWTVVESVPGAEIDLDQDGPHPRTPTVPSPPLPVSTSEEHS